MWKNTSYTILAKQESIREQCESNISCDSVLLGKRSRPCEFSDINDPFIDGILWPLPGIFILPDHSCVRKHG